MIKNPIAPIECQVHIISLPPEIVAVERAKNPEAIVPINPRLFRLVQNSPLILKYIICK